MKKSLLIIGLVVLVLLTSCNTGQEPESTPTITPVPTPSAEEIIQDGSNLLKSDRYDEAIAAFLTAIELDPESSTAHAKLAQGYFLKGLRNPDVLATAEKAVELEPDNPIAMAILGSIQLSYLMDAEGRENIDHAYDLDPDDPMITRIKARSHLYSYEYDEAWEIIESLEEDPSENTDRLLLIAEYYWSTGRFQAAEAVLRQAIDSDPDRLDGLLGLAGLSNQRGHYETAFDLYNSILERDPESIDARVGLAVVHLSRYEYDQADAFIESLEEDYPEEHYAHHLRTSKLLRQEEYDEALREADKALELFPESMNTNYLIGQIHNLEGSCERSRIHFQDLSDKYPNEISYQIGEAMADFCDGKYDRASSTLKNVLKTDPYEYFAKLALANAYMAQGRWDDADRTLIEAMSITPNLAAVHQSTAQYFLADYNLEDAKIEILKAIELDPYMLDSYLLLTDIYLYSDEYRQASDTIKAAGNLDPDYSEVIYYEGLVAYYYGDANSASKKLQTVLDEDPENYRAHLYLGLAHRDLGNYEDAFNEIQSYVSLMGNSLGETDVKLLDVFLTTLDQGYVLTQNRFLTDFEEFLTAAQITRANPRFEDIKGKGNTFVMDLYISSVQMNDGSYIGTTTVIFTLGSLYLPRIEPEVKGGIRINIKVNGQDHFSIDAPLDLLTKFADTLVPAPLFITSMEYNLPDNFARSVTYNRIFQETAKVRELPLKNIPPQSSITPEQVEERLTGGVDEQAQAALLNEIAFLTLLEVLPDDFDYESAREETFTNNIAGFYSPVENQIYLVTREEISHEDRLVLSHESTHALQFQEFDLSEYSDNDDLNEDERRAYLALIEGDATFSSLLYLEEYVPLVDQITMAGTSAGIKEDQEIDSHPFLTDFFTFPYLYGLGFVNALYQRGGWEEVNAAYENPPASTEQIMHPELYFNGDIPRPVGLETDLEKIPDHYSIEKIDVLGELGIYLMMTEYFGPFTGFDAARGWGGDEYAMLLDTETNEYSLVVKIVWDGPKEATEFADLYQAAMMHRSGYSMLLDEFISEPMQFTWTNGPAFIMLNLENAETILILGPAKDKLDTLMTALIE